MIETRPSGEEPETTHVLDVAPEGAPQQRFLLLRAALWWVFPATALIAGGWTAAMVLAAAAAPYDLSTALACGAAAAVALFGGMCVFERLIGLPGAALGAGVTLQLIHSPFVESGIIPGWSTSMGWGSHGAGDGGAELAGAHPPALDDPHGPAGWRSPRERSPS